MLDAIDIRKHLVKPVRDVVLGNVDVTPTRVGPIDLEEEAPKGLAYFS